MKSSSAGATVKGDSEGGVALHEPLKASITVFIVPQVFALAISAESYIVLCG